MPLLGAHPEPLIPEHAAHQRLRSDSIDLACSAASSSFLGRLWPKRRKFAPPFKSASVGAAQEICELSKPSKYIGLNCEYTSCNSPNWINFDSLHCNGDSPREDCEDGQLNDTPDLQDLKCNLGSQDKGLHCKEAFPECVNREGNILECRKDACRDFPFWVVCEENVECRGEGSEGEITELQEVGVKPIMESLKEVVISKQRINNGTEATCVYGIQEDSKGSEPINVCGVKKEGDQKEGVDQMLTKRLASFKAGEVHDTCGVKKMRMSTLFELQRVAGTLQWGTSLDERWLAADELRRLCKDDPIARVTLGVQLGVVPPLVFLLHSPHSKHQCTALLALLNLAMGNDVNKGAIVKAKAVPRMVGLLQSAHVEVQTATVNLFLSLSALDGNKAEIGASGSVAVLVTLLHAHHTKKDALRTLYNLSIHADNVKFIVEAGGVPILLVMVSDIDVADKSLATLGNLVQTDVGRHSFIDNKEVSYAVLIEAMRYMEMPKCQERAVYVLMMIAHHSRPQREAMVAAGIIPALLELSLLGSPLAQKRATRTLDSFRRAKAFSAPQQRESLLPVGTDSTDPQQSIARTMSEKKVVDGLVRQSLHRTMQRITRRANLSTVLGDPVVAKASSTLWRFRCPVERRSSPCSLSY